MLFDKLSTVVCCKFDILIGTRIISFIGLIISAILITILLNDRYTDNYYDLSRKTALALGLDWRHLHTSTCTLPESDPEGKMISIVVISYSVAFLVTNSMLLFGTIKTDWRFAIPWMVCELLGCLSKLGALIYHWIVDPNKLSHLFTAGSMLYIVIMVWWWLIVCTAQMCWRQTRKHPESLCGFELSFVDPSCQMSKERVQSDDIFCPYASSSSSTLPYCSNTAAGVTV